MIEEFARITQAVEVIGNTSAYTQKKYLLKSAESLPGFKEVLKFIYNPYHKTHISANKFEKVKEYARGMLVVDKAVDSYKDVIEYLTRHNTGTDSDLMYIASFIATLNFAAPQCLSMAQALVTQDLQIGVTSSTLNTVYGKGFIPKIGCMLGTRIDDVPEQRRDWPMIVTEKLDGIRRILIKENGIVRAYSRSGHEDTGIVDIIEEAARYLPNNRVYDGELLATGTFADCIALRQATNSIGNSKGRKSGLTFNIFDMIPLEEFKAGASEDGAAVRKLLLGATLGDESIQKLGVEDWPKLIEAYSIHADLEFIKPVPILGMVNNMSMVEPFVEEIWAKQGEGVMLNTLEGRYEIKRSKALLKVKRVKEYKLKVVGMIEGEGKFEGMLGALVVEYKGQKVGVGSGFTEAQRIHVWQNQDSIIDSYIEVDSFGESRNTAGGISLNCPIFKRFAGEEE